METTDRVAQYLHIAGIRKDNPEWGPQYGLCSASIGDLGVRCGLDDRVKSVLRSRGLGVPTLEGMHRFLKLLSDLEVRNV